MADPASTTSATAHLILQIGVVVGISRLVGLVFRRFGQPQVVAEILAGLMLGPSLLGWVAPGVLARLFPSSSLPGLQSLSDLGLILFMFVVGLEFDATVLRRQGKVALGASLGGILLPLALGSALAVALHPTMAPAGVGVVPFALFVGTAMSVTAFPVLARILVERGLVKTDLGAITMTCAALADVVAWCLVGFVVSLVRAQGSPAAALLTTVYAAAFVGAMFYGVRPFMARVAERFGRKKGLTVGGLAAVTLLLLSSALVAEWIGIHALLGAFVFGVMVPRQGRMISWLVSRIEDLVVVVLLPIFFALTGLKTDLRAVFGGDLGGVTLLILGVAIFGKVVGTALPARWAGMGTREATSLGVLMNTRGLVELVILSIGLELGVLSPPLFAAMVVMAVATTFMTTPLIRLLAPPSRGLGATAGPANLPARSFSLLVSVARAESVPGMARVATALCSGPDARAYALSIGVESDQAGFSGEEDMLAEAEKTAGDVAAHLEGAGVSVTAQAVSSDDPARTIAQVARAKRVDAVLVGFHLPLFGTAVLGGPLKEIGNLVDGDLCMFHDRGLQRVQRVVCGRGGDNEEGAYRTALRLAYLSKTTVEMVDVAAGFGPLRQLDPENTVLVVGEGEPWGIGFHTFDVKRLPLLTEVRCSLMVVYDGAERTHTGVMALPPPAKA